MNDTERKKVQQTILLRGGDKTSVGTLFSFEEGDIEVIKAKGSHLYFIYDSCDGNTYIIEYFKPRNHFTWYSEDK